MRTVAGATTGSLTRFEWYYSINWIALRIQTSAC